MGICLYFSGVVVLGGSSQLRVCMEKKIGGGFFVSRPLACLLFFLASADYSAVLPDFVVALGCLSETGFALLIRVELDGNSGLVLISLLLA